MPHRGQNNQEGSSVQSLQLTVPLKSNELLDERSGVGCLLPTPSLSDLGSQLAVKFNTSSRVDIKERSLSTVSQPTRIIKPDTSGLTLLMFLVEW